MAQGTLPFLLKSTITMSTRGLETYLKSSATPTHALYKYSQIMGIGVKTSSGLSSNFLYMPLDLLKLFRFALSLSLSLSHTHTLTKKFSLLGVLRLLILCISSLVVEKKKKKPGFYDFRCVCLLLSEKLLNP